VKESLQMLFNAAKNNKIESYENKIDCWKIEIYPVRLLPLYVKDTSKESRDSQGYTIEIYYNRFSPAFQLDMSGQVFKNKDAILMEFVLKASIIRLDGSTMASYHQTDPHIYETLEHTLGYFSRCAKRNKNIAITPNELKSILRYTALKLT